METLKTLKTKLIDRIMVSDNEELLDAIASIFDSVKVDEPIHLNSYQIEMLQMSERDIEEGNVISEEDLFKEDSKWMD